MSLSRRQLLVCVAALGSAACSRGKRPAPGPVTRVVSLSPNTTEAVFAIGAGDRLVGRSRHCDYPREAVALPVVGGFADPNLEAVLALAPDLVVGARGPAGPDVARALEAQGIATYFPVVDSVADIGALLVGLGERLGRVAAAEALADAIRRDLEAVRAAHAEGPRVRAAMVFEASPLVVAGPGGFPDELLGLAGGANVIGAGGAYPQIELERLVALDPEVLIDASAELDTPPTTPSVLLTLPGFAGLAAVRGGRVRRLTTAAAVRPGPRIALGLYDIARALHGPA
ncbi:MAG: ABC transporter substrate-binding protein [Polyangiaceae bacterium]|nr:ABC transporter substrate-binding protein [Polyangiaceae bacterium]